MTPVEEERLIVIIEAEVLEEKVLEKELEELTPEAEGELIVVIKAEVKEEQVVQIFEELTP